VAQHLGGSSATAAADTSTRRAPVRTSAARRAPGPRLGSLATLPRFVARKFDFLADCARRYGDVYRLPLGLADITVVNHPDHVGCFLTENADNYLKGRMNRRLLPALGDGIPISEGERWRRSRRLLNPMFSRKSLDGMVGIVAGSIDDTLTRWELLAEVGETVELTHEIGVLTMQVLQRAMFSSSVRDEGVPELVAQLRALSLWMGGLMATVWAPRWIPVPYQRRGQRARAGLDATLDRIVAERRANPIESPDLLNLLLAARFDDGEPLEHEHLRAELRGLLFGGYDTTGSALAWTFALLGSRSEWAEALRAEADALGDRLPGLAELADLEVSRALFDEAQRIQGALLLTREAVDDDEIAGYKIPAGSLVGVSSYSLHRNPEFWPDPERFDPTRFMGERRRAQHRYQFLPFGAGPRHCIGANLAYLEGQLALLKVARRFDVEIDPGYVPRHRFHLSTGLRGGLPCRLRTRRQ